MACACYPTGLKVFLGAATTPAWGGPAVDVGEVHRPVKFGYDDHDSNIFITASFVPSLVCLDRQSLRGPSRVRSRARQIQMPMLTVVRTMASCTQSNQILLLNRRRSGYEIPRGEPRGSTGFR